MTLDTNNIQFHSEIPGFGNYTSTTFSVSIPSQSIGVGAYVKYSAHAALNNSNAVSQVLVQYSGVETSWRLMTGSIFFNLPNNTSPSYQIESVTYYKSGNVYVDTYISNQSGSSVVIPAITVNCKASLFKAPF